MIKKYNILFLIFLSLISLHAFRSYDLDNPVARFYYENHTKQTLTYVLEKKAQYQEHLRNGNLMSVWQALEQLNTIIDDSDPDTQLPQIQHALQTAERLRHDGRPRWLILTGLIHDLGKLLVLHNEPQWTVVGDTFPVGCAYAKEIIYYDYFKDNPDWYNALFQTTYGIYSPHCGLDNLHLSFGHDEYLYYVVKDYLPEEALYIIRYHSFYAQHQHNAYDHLLNDHDQQMFYWVKLFQPYDLYSKESACIDITSVKNYYKELINEFFPAQIRW